MLLCRGLLVSGPALVSTPLSSMPGTVAATGRYYGRDAFGSAWALDDDTSDRIREAQARGQGMTMTLRPRIRSRR